MKFEFSAGGVVIQKDKDQKLVLVAKHSAHHGWVFPKGLIEKNKETKEEAALREVKEETGITGKIVRVLSPTPIGTCWTEKKSKKLFTTFLWHMSQVIQVSTILKWSLLSGYRLARRQRD